MSNLIHDFISAGISTFLAVGISMFFYHLGNRNAYKQDVLEPIKCALRDSTIEESILNLVQDKKKLYSLRFAHKNEKAKIYELEEACKNAIENSYENSFSESMWNHFYALIGESRSHIQSNDYGDTEELNYPDERGFDLKQYAGWVNQDGEYVCGDKIKDCFTLFYREIISGSKDVDELLADFDVDKVWSASEEYKKYQNANYRLDSIKNAILTM